MIDSVINEPGKLLSSEQLMQAFNLSPESMMITTLDEGIYLEVNQTFIDTMGYCKEEIIGQKSITVRMWATPEEREQGIAELLANHGRIRGREITYVDHEGRLGVGLWSANIIKLGDKECILSWLLDITYRKQMEESLRKSEEHFRMLAENASDIIYRFSLKPRKVEYMSPSIKSITGYTPEDHYNNPWLIFDIVHPDDRQELMKPAALYNENPVIIRWISREGKTIWTEQRNRIIYNADQQPIALQGIARDITQRVLLEEHLRHTSLHDALTGLYNRAFFEEAMHRLEYQRQNEGIAIIACDVDGLKLVNDIMGHAEGDSIIKAAANVLESAFRQADIVARVGGDEFSVIVTPANKSLALELCKRVTSGVEDYNQATRGVPLGLSVGYALRVNNDNPLAEIYRDADSEMYRHKMHNRKQYRQQLLRTMALNAERPVYSNNSELHIERLKLAVNIFAHELKVSRKRVEMLMRLAEFHDIGAVLLPSDLLSTTQSLSDDDWVLLRQHCENGFRIANIVPEMNPIAEAILSHHEHWDGQGYPRGLKGNRIPLESRIIAIADAFSAMTCPRSYREAMPEEMAVAELKNAAGTQFDPELVDKFIASYQRSRLMDNH